MKNYILPILSVAMLLFAGFHVASTQQAHERPPPPIQPAMTPYERQVAGLGLVEARTENVNIGSHLQGVVTKVFVKEGDHVRAGQPLYQLDSRHIEAVIRVRQAMLSAAQSQLAKLVAMPRAEELPPMTARVNEAQANLRLRKDVMDRSQKLVAGGAVSDEVFVRDQLSVATAQAQLERSLAEQKLLEAGAWSADIAVAQAAVEQAQASLEQTQIELSRLQVLAPEMYDLNGKPVEWEVLRVKVRPGEFAGNTPNQELIVLGDLGPRHVRVDIDENDIPRFKPAADAVAYARGSAEREYKLKFVRIQPFVVPKRSLSGDTVERVDTRVLQVIYSIEEDDRSVFVGQQMEVFVREDEKQTAPTGPQNATQPVPVVTSQM